MAVDRSVLPSNASTLGHFRWTEHETESAAPQTRNGIGGFSVKRCRRNNLSATEAGYVGAMRVLVTGGAGYIGSHTSLRLLEEGHQVAVLDNFINSGRESLERVESLAGGDIEVHEGDVRDPSTFKSFFKNWRPESVIHFAGLKSVSESVENPGSYYTTNVQGTVNVAESSVANDVRSLIFSSSATVYSSNAVMPVHEESELGPSNPYGWSKLMAEQVLRDIHAAHPQLSIAILRYFNPVGAHASGMIGEDPAGVPANLMPYMARVADGTYPALNVFGTDYPTDDGTGVRDYIHVVDLAEAHLAAISHMSNSPGRVTWNIGRGQGISVLEMVDAFQRVTKAPVPVALSPRRPGDVAVSFADPTRITSESAWRATRDVDTMVEDLWRWQLQNPQGYSTR